MTICKYGKELAEMMTLWNCGEKEAAQQFLQAIYIAEGNRPNAAAEFINTLSDDELANSFSKVLDACRKVSHSDAINLLDLKPTRV